MKLNKQDLASGLLLTVFGILFASGSTSYDIGTLSSMGPGFYPLILSIALIVIGIITIGRSFTVNRDINVDFKIPLLFALCIIGYVLLLTYISGILATIFVVVSTAALDKKFSTSRAALVAAIAVVIFLCFKFLIGSNIPL